MLEILYRAKGLKRKEIAVFGSVYDREDQIAAEFGLDLVPSDPDRVVGREEVDLPPRHLELGNPQEGECESRGERQCDSQPRGTYTAGKIDEVSLDDGDQIQHF